MKTRPILKATGVFFVFMTVIFSEQFFSSPSLTPPPIPQESDSKELVFSANQLDTKRKIATFYDFTEWLNRCSVEIDGRIQGKAPSIAIPWRDDTQYLTTSWAYGLNLTAVAMARSSPRPVAITPRHVVTTKHYGYHPWPGQIIRFLTMDNRIISRVVDQVKYLGSPNNTVVDKDVAVSRLNEDLPGSITPMKLISPDALSDVPAFSCPVLRLDQENKALLVAANLYSSLYPLAKFLNPTGQLVVDRILQYVPFYENMIAGDSSSSSILIYRDQFGITPFLLSQVTYAGVGNGSNQSALASEIQAVINGFGDTQSKYQLVFGPFEFSGHRAPSCSITANRIDNTGNCSISVQGSGDSTTGNPMLLPINVSNWTKSGNIWSGTAPCSKLTSTTFTAQLKGPGGTGAACESGEVKPAPPSCNLTAFRQGATDTCNISVTRTQGNVTGDPTLTPTAPTSWSKSGDVWTSTINCSISTNTTFSATLSGPDGTGPACNATVYSIDTAPTCSLVATRTGTSDTCQLNLTAGGSFDTMNSPEISPGASGTWSGTNWTGSGSCPVNQNTTFSAIVKGFIGASVTCQSSVIAPVPPACNLNVTRNGNTDTCTYSITSTSPAGTINKVVQTLNGNAIYRDGFTWNNADNPTQTFSNFVCAASNSFDFKALIEGPGGQFTCSSLRVEAVPKPTCSVTATRVGSTAQCNLTVRRTGGVASGNPTVTPAAPTSWTTATDSWSGTASCPTSSNTVFTATLSGPGGTGTACYSAVVPKLNLPPSCSLSVTRQGNTYVCSVAVNVFGQYSGAPQMSPYPRGRWSQSGNVWSNTATCIRGRLTSFNITVSGPYGKGYCGGAIK